DSEDSFLSESRIPRPNIPVCSAARLTWDACLGSGALALMGALAVVHAVPAAPAAEHVKLRATTTQRTGQRSSGYASKSPYGVTPSLEPAPSFFPLLAI